MDKMLENIFAFSHSFTMMLRGGGGGGGVLYHIRSYGDVPKAQLLIYLIEEKFVGEN